MTRSAPLSDQRLLDGVFLTMAQDFENLFKNVYPDYHILEQRILKDGNGISRGVGFARYVLRRFMNTSILTRIQIRDT